MTVVSRYKFRLLMSFISLLIILNVAMIHSYPFEVYQVDNVTTVEHDLMKGTTLTENTVVEHDRPVNIFTYDLLYVSLISLIIIGFVSYVFAVREWFTK